MKQISLGRHRLKVPPIVLGSAVMREMDGFPIFGKTDEKQVVSTIHRSLELGGNFLDIADPNHLPENEKLIGRAIEGKRDQYILAAKFRYGTDDIGHFARQTGDKRAYVKNTVERTLKNLGTDYIDIYYLQQPDKEESIEETMQAMVKMIREGKIRYVGLSDPSKSTILRAQKIHPVAAVQLEYSLFNRTAEQVDIPEILKNLGIGFIARSPLGRGFLTGDTRIKSMDGFPVVPDEQYERKMALAFEIKKMAEEKDIPAAQLAIAWNMAKGSLPVVCSRQIKHLEENIAAAGVQLSSSDMSRLETMVPA
jgi:aryl-alcohol dehydrogenase-like predicted oxidoreductase